MLGIGNGISNWNWQRYRMMLSEILRDKWDCLIGASVVANIAFVVPGEQRNIWRHLKTCSYCSYQLLTGFLWPDNVYAANGQLVTNIYFVKIDRIVFKLQTILLKGFMSKFLKTGRNLDGQKKVSPNTNTFWRTFSMHIFSQIYTALNATYNTNTGWKVKILIFSCICREIQCWKGMVRKPM